jgi:GH25 family lysozyme M1 (1,4-beta-N-acetylmuramidase)
VIPYPDLSNNNWSTHQDVIDFLTAMKSSGIHGAVHKVSQGSSFVDEFWPTFRSWSEENDSSWLGFHYVDTSDPDAQAENFLANNGGPFAMLDFEAGGGDINNFWNVVNAFNAAGVSVSLGYLPNWYWGDIHEPDLSDLPANQISLVSSNYGWLPTGSPVDIYSALGGDNGPGWRPYGGAAPTVWQFTDRASIGGHLVDCNVYRGSSLDALFTGNVF